jgi:hypothetical protein
MKRVQMSETCHVSDCMQGGREREREGQSKLHTAAYRCTTAAYCCDQGGYGWLSAAPAQPLAFPHCSKRPEPHNRTLLVVIRGGALISACHEPEEGSPPLPNCAAPKQRPTTAATAHPGRRQHRGTHLPLLPPDFRVSKQRVSGTALEACCKRDTAPLDISRP